MTNTAPILSRFRLPLAALALALPAMAASDVAAQSVQDFQLPPNPTPTPTEPQVQGPVDIEAPLQTAPRQIPAVRPSSTPTPLPTAAPARQTAQQPTRRAPAQTAPTLSEDARRFTPARQQVRLPRPVAPAAQPAQPARQLPEADSTAEIASPVTESNLPGFSSDFPETVPLEAGESGMGANGIGEGGWPWAWIMGFAALLAALLAGVFWWRKRAEEAVPATIAPPLVKTSARIPAAAPPAANGSDTASALSSAPDHSIAQWVRMEAHALELQRTMMNANLTYRLVIANRSGKALTNLKIEADLATAHGQLPVEDQLALPGRELTVRETIERLAPGERLELRSNIMLPLSEVKIIQQGPKALLCVPLLRVRAVCEGRDPIARTWVVGQQTTATRGRVQPFRFDAPPQIYKNIGQRALD